MSNRPRHVVLRDWRDYVAMPENELARHDIATVNLACATGLPGAEEIDVGWCLGWLARATDEVRRWTDAGLDEMFRPNPAAFNFSEPQFKVLGLTSVLQRHCGVRYDSSKIGAKPTDPFELHEQFVHGVMQGPGGTCATLPVVYASIGRRLGYPIRLASARQHLFARWDDPLTQERFNIECSGVGFADPPDNLYRAWPLPISGPDEEKACGYLTSFTPRRELASFIANRAFVLRDHKRFREANETVAVAIQLDPRNIAYPRNIQGFQMEWDAHLKARFPPQFPRQIVIDIQPGRARWRWMPWEVERSIALLETTEWCLNNPSYERWWWGPLREGRTPHRTVPKHLSVDYDRMVRNP